MTIQVLHSTRGRAIAAALAIGLWLALGWSGPLLAQSPELGLGTGMPQPVSQGSNYSLSSVSGAAVANAQVLSGGDHRLLGRFGGRPATAAVDTTAVVGRNNPCTAGGIGDALFLCVTVENVGNFDLTHHRLIAPALALDEVVEGFVGSGETLVLSVPSPATSPVAVFMLEIISSNNPALADDELPGILFPAFGSAQVGLEIYADGPQYYLPMITNQ